MDHSASFAIHTLELGPMENFVYLLEDRETRQAAVVDPAWDVPEVIRLAEQRDLKITDILLTHSHHDHINGIRDVLDKFDARLHLLKAESQFWGQELDMPSLHHGGDVIRIGQTEIEVLHTPGHTPGSACYLLDGNVITGDTLFVFGCGRCDLRGGDPEQMHSTLKNMIERLPADTVIHPGHNYAEKSTSTMEEQVNGNPFMHFAEVDRFIKYRMRWHDKHRDSPYQAVKKGCEMPD